MIPVPRLLVGSDLRTQDDKLEELLDGMIEMMQPQRGRFTKGDPGPIDLSPTLRSRLKTYIRHWIEHGGAVGFQ